MRAFTRIRDWFDPKPVILYVGFPLSPRNNKKRYENKFVNYLKDRVGRNTPGLEEWPEWLTFKPVAPDSTRGTHDHVLKKVHWRPAAAEDFTRRLALEVSNLCKQGGVEQPGPAK